MRGYDKSPVTPPLHSSPSTPGFVTPDSIGGPCLPPSNTMDTRIRGYDKIVVRPYCGRPPLRPNACTLNRHLLQKPTGVT